MGTTSSKPNSTVTTTTKPKKRTTAPAKGHYDHNQHFLPAGYWPSGTEGTYGYPYPGVAPTNYAPVIPPPVMPQYPPYHSAGYPAPPITMPQPQPYVHPQPASRPVIPAAARPAAQAVAKPQPQPVIPSAPPRERPKKHRSTRKTMPRAIITFELPDNEHARRPSEANPPPPPDLSRSLSSDAPSQQGRSTSQPQTPQLSTSSPTRSIHQRRASTHTHSTPQTHRSTNSVVLPPPTDERPSNPLPELPVDVFATTPYRHVLELQDLPPWPPLEPTKTFVVQQEIQKAPPQTKKGLFGLKKKGPPPPLSQTKLVYLPPPASATISNPPTTATSIGFPPRSATIITPPTSAMTTDASHTGFQPPIAQKNSDPGHGGLASTLPPIYFNQDTVYAPFLNHSPHSVSYERVTYPTATHLIEAMKFLPESDHNQGIAELIRKCVDLADVYRLSHERREAQIEESGESYMAKMERVMYLKFYQHGDLADLLLSTGEAPLIYDDPSDSFWGIGEVNGEPGQNELGQMLEVVRARLRHERMK